MENEQHKPLDLAGVRAKLAGAKGAQYWRGLEELAETKEFQDFLEDEFPQQARPLRMEVDRRQFLTLAGASLALAGLSGCRYLEQPRIVPYVNQPEDLTLGIPMVYATAATLGEDVIGLLVTSREGRPIKIEGNPDHPNSLGATDAITQASLLTLYDPDRAQTVLKLGQDSTFDDFLEAVRPVLAEQKKTGGAGLRFLSETVMSPTLADQIQTLLAQFPNAQWRQYDPVSRDSLRAAATQAFGEPVNTIYHFDKADRILSLDADFLLSMPGHVRYARDFSSKRRVRLNTKAMNRLYVAESAPTITGAMADHRYHLKPSEVEAFAFAVAQEMQIDLGGVTPPALQAASTSPDVESGGETGKSAAPVPESDVHPWITACVKDLQAVPGASIVIAGDHTSPAVHVLVHAMNAKLGNVGKTVTYTDPVEHRPEDQGTSLKSLVDDMQAGKVQALFILGGNPVYNAPVDIPFAQAMTGKGSDGKEQVPFRVRLGMFEDETSAACQWHIPESHYLEAWSDARAFDGTTSIVQPLIQPLYDSKSAHELLDILTAIVTNKEEFAAGYDIVTGYWQKQRPSPDFAKFMERSLRDGIIADTTLPEKTVTPKAGAITPSASPASAPAGADTVEIAFRPDPTIWDGRYANNGWLQELPKPLTKLTWDNAVLISPATAQRLGFDIHDFDELLHDPRVEIAYRGRKLEAAYYVMAGHPDDTITLHLGYGRTNAGRLGTGAGFNAYALRTSDSPTFGVGVTLKRLPGDYALSTTQHHFNMEGRGPVQEATLEAWLKNPQFARTPENVDPSEADSMYSDARQHEFKYEGFGDYHWGMSIDNNVCIGCNACMVACQAENNISVVGKDQVGRGRSMHWIRIDTYYGPRGGRNTLENPTTFFEPVPCMHCENAPCEPVCPVAAAVHSHEGLNMQIYNRCVGTRYCSNNCPYKVRRFNFYKYAAGQPNNVPGNFDIPVIKLVANPEVTIRGRGVMEKCSYCVQRINLTRIKAKNEFREIKDGEVQTACQQVCPTEAIVFGDISRSGNKVAQLKSEPHDYSLLGELNTRPRTTYLAKLRNPNPEIEPATESNKEG